MCLGFRPCANTRDRYESFVLAPGESKVEVEIDTRELFFFFFLAQL